MYFYLAPAKKENDVKKNVQLKVLNALLALLLVSQALTGLFRDSLPDAVFEDIHVPGGLLIITGVILHVILNWGWVRVNFLKK